jgi:hypothetical protein
MADVLTVVAKIRAAKGKGDAREGLTEGGVEVEFYRSVTD